MTTDIKTKEENKELKQDEMEKVVGGAVHPATYLFLCNDCGQHWEANSTKLGKICPSCGSTNVHEY